MRCRFLPLFLSGTVLALPATAVDLPHLQQLMQEQQYENAYKLASKAEETEAGNPAFDYWYGLAALESGRAHRAVYALERVLMNEPEKQTARLALARAYAKTGQLDLARAMLNTILVQNASAPILEQARAELAALPPNPKARRTRWSGALALTSGYDNNVNATTDLEQLPQPPATVLLLDSSARAREDGFARLDVETRLEHDLGQQASLILAMEGYENLNFHESEFNTSLLTGYGGGAYRAGSHFGLLYASYQRLWLDHASYLEVITPTLAWQYAVGSQGRIELGVAVSNYEYDDFTTRDSEGVTFSAGWRQTFSTSGRARSRLSLYAGNERAKDPRFEYFGRDYAGLQWRVEFDVASRHQPYAHLRWQASDYLGLDPIYASVREDRYWRFGLGWRYRLQPRLQVGAELEYTSNESSITLYEFDRTRVFVTSRYEWR